MKPIVDPGPLLADYPARPLQPRDLSRLLIGGSLAVLLPLGYGFLLAANANARYGPSAAAAWSRPWYLAAIALLAGFILVLGVRFLQAQRKLAIHKNGVRLNFSRPAFLPWQSIAGISSETIQERFLGLPVRTRHSARLYPTVGKPVQLNGFRNLPELLTQLKANLYPRIYPDLLVGFRDGKWLHFGPVAVQNQALQVNGKSFAWTEVRSISFCSGDLVIEAPDRGPIRVPAGRIPNPELLLELIKQEVSV